MSAVTPGGFVTPYTYASANPISRFDRDGRLDTWSNYWVQTKRREKHDLVRLVRRPWQKTSATETS